MARPARVRMRSRKPWVFARRRLFGWKVRLLTSGLQAQDASPAHGDARQWLACQMRGMRNSRRVASRPSYVTGQARPRSNRRTSQSARVQVIHLSTGTFSTGAPPSTGCALCPPVLPLGCGQRLVHSCGQDYRRLLRTLSPLRGRVGPRVTDCAQPVDSVWISNGAHEGATGRPACGQRRDPVLPAAIDVDKQIAVGQRGPRREERSRPMDGTDLSAVWARALENSLNENVPSQQRVWLSMTRPFGLMNDTVVLAAPTDFARDVLENKLRPLISHALSQEFGRPMRVAVMVDPSAAGPEPGLASRQDPYPQAQPQGYTQAGGAQQGYTQPANPQHHGGSGPHPPYQGGNPAAQPSTEYPQAQPFSYPYQQAEESPSRTASQSRPRLPHRGTRAPDTPAAATPRPRRVPSPTPSTAARPRCPARAVCRTGGTAAGAGHRASRPG